jgi:hypothetical protein
MAGPGKADIQDVAPDSETARLTPPAEDATARTAVRKSIIFDWSQSNLDTGSADDASGPLSTFDFVQIRYQNSVQIRDAPRIFQLAFEQIKPGGWVEVVETRPALWLSDIAQCHRSGSADTGSGSQSRSLSTKLIQKQLINAGYEDVQDKTFRRRSSLWATVGRVWRRVRALDPWFPQGCGKERGEVDEKFFCRGEDGELMVAPTGCFVIGRKPLG